MTRPRRSGSRTAPPPLRRRTVPRTARPTSWSCGLRSPRRPRPPDRPAARPGGALSALPDRRPLVEERQHPLTLVLGLEQRLEPVALEAEPVVERQRLR